MLGDRREDVDGRAVRPRDVDGGEFDPGLHQVRMQFTLDFSAIAETRPAQAIEGATRRQPAASGRHDEAPDLTQLYFGQVDLHRLGGSDRLRQRSAHWPA